MHDLCVVLDVDDTLYLEREYAVSGFRAAGRWASEWLSIPDFDIRCRNLLERGRRGNIFDLALHECGREAPPALIAGLVAIYQAPQPTIGVADDAAIALHKIRARWPIAIISDGPVASQSLKCDALGLTSWANSIVLTGMMGEEFRKPFPGAFKLVASRIPARQFVYVADNPDKDFAAPQQLGWHTVRIRREGGLHFDKSNYPEQPDFELPDCTGLETVLLSLAARTCSRPAGATV